MGYFETAELSQDSDFVKRCAACAATEPSPPGDPMGWVLEHSWQLAAQPGFSDAYSYAVANDNPQPGRDPAVITDAQILGGVQALLSG